MKAYLQESTEDEICFIQMETIVTIPTDEGKSWYVVFLAFCQNFVKESMPYTFLIFNSKYGNEFSQEFGFFIGSFYFCMCYLFSPLACALANWYSFTVLNVVGPIIMALSMLASHYVCANEYYYILILTYSVLGGFGCSMIHMSSKLMPSYWFCNKRHLAHSLACSGQAFGFLVIPSITTLVCSEEFMVKIFFLFSLLVLPLIALGVLTPRMPGIKVYFKRKSLPMGSDTPKVRFQDEVRAAMASVEKLGDTSSYRLFRTHHNLVFPRVKDVIGDSDLTVLIPNEGMRKTLMRPYRHGTKPKMSHTESGTTVVCGYQEVTMIYKKDLWPIYGARPMYRIDIFYTWSLFNVSIYYRQDNQLDYHLAVTRAMSRRDLLQEQYKRRVLCPEAIIRTLITMLDCSIVSSGYYVMLQINLFLISVGQIIPLAFLTRRGDEAGHESDSDFLLVYAALGQIFGRLLVTSLGLFSTNSSFFDLTVFILWAGGGLTVAVAFVQDYYNLMVYSIAFGVAYALLQTLRLTVVYSIIKLMNLTNTIGHSLLLQGLGSVFAITFAGYLFSKYKTVKYAYIFSGATLVFSGFFLIAVKLVKNYTFRRLTISV